MADLVSIAGSAVAAYQRALGTVANNIANVDSAGYSRQEINLIENSPRAYGTSFLGTGVNVAGVRRLYDAFIENSLRNANTELGTQEPLVNYANRVVDIMGNEDVGLLSAFDQFFDSARQLATDPSSLILRGQFLTKAEGLASRFQTLNSQLELVAKETQEAVESELREFNSLAEQLALVNGQLGKTKILQRQPPALMDQRDEILRKMSSLAKIQVKEETNGVVEVSIGSSATRGRVVAYDKALPVVAVFNDNAVGKVDLLINPGAPSAETVFGFTGGSISGLLGFRRQLLEPTFLELDNLAKTLVQETNAIHREGLDLEGRSGLDLFRIDPQFKLTSEMGETGVLYKAQITDLDAFSSSTLRLDYRDNAGQINNVLLTGQFRVGDTIRVSLNGSSKEFTLFDPPPIPTNLTPEQREARQSMPLEMDTVRRQIMEFLQGGNGDSIDGAFGRVIDVQLGSRDDLLITSPVLGAYNLTVEAVSGAGRVDDRITRGQWTLTDTTTGQFTTGTTSLTLNGIDLELSGSARDGEILFLEIGNSASAGIRLGLDDPMRVAAAARFRVIENQFNPSGTSARLVESPESHPSDRELWLDQTVGTDGRLLDNNALPNSDVVVRFDRLPTTPVTIIPAGYTNTTLYLGDLGGEPVDLQVFTRDGRHIVGRQLADVALAAREAALGRPLNDDERAAIIDEAGEDFVRNARLAGVSFAPNSSYSASYLNGVEDAAYRDMEVFYGVKAKVERTPELTLDHVYKTINTDGTPIEQPASVRSQAIAPLVADVDAPIFTEGALNLNGRSLAQLRVVQLKDPDGNLRLTAGGDRIHLLEVTETDELGDAREIYIEAIKDDEDNLIATQYWEWKQNNDSSWTLIKLNSSRNPLSPQVTGTPVGLALNSDGKVELGASHLKAWMDFSAFPVGMSASALTDDAVELVRANPFEVVFVSPSQYKIAGSETLYNYSHEAGLTHRSMHLSFTSTPMAGDRFVVDGLQDQRSQGLSIQVTKLEDAQGRPYEVLDFARSINRDPEAREEDSEIRIGLGRDGRTTDLAKLGFRTGVYVHGAAKEDLLVFATNTSVGADSTPSFTLGATYTQGSVDAIEAARAEPFEVVFTSSSHYAIREIRTGTVLAERIYDPSAGVRYRGLTLSFNANPQAGDRFLVDGNQDGIGNNGTALRLADLQNQRVVGGGKGLTLSEAYGEAVGNVGNTAFQASIAQKALEVVRDQAVQARDKVSGVSLDEEAADLIRFQQAYQASAKVMQTANTLFDAILGIR